jgi:hypothetical protein
MAKKSIQRTVRFEEETISQLNALCAAADIEAPKLIRALIGAAHRYYEQNGKIYLPIEIRPFSETPTQVQVETKPKRKNAA